MVMAEPILRPMASAMSRPTSTLLFECLFNHLADERVESLFTITADKHEVRRNPEYYVMRHFSHFVRPGAKVLGTTGHFNSMAIAFRNPDGTVVVVAQNALDEERPFAFADPDAAERGFKVTLAPRSFNTFVLD